MNLNSKIFLSIFFSIISFSVSANSIILPEVLNISRLGLTDQSDTIYFTKRADRHFYLLGELTAQIDNKNTRSQIFDEYITQLENSGWVAAEYANYDTEFEKQITEECKLQINIVGENLATVYFNSIKKFPKAIYFYLILNEPCEKTQLHKLITSKYKNIKYLALEDIQNVKQPPQPFGAVRQASQIPTFSDNLKLTDLIDFDSHASLSPLENCHTKTLFAAGYEPKIACFNEDRSSNSDYLALDESKVYDKKPYISTWAGAFFRKQEFRAFPREGKERKAENDYDSLANEDKMPILVDVGLYTEIYPEGCFIGAWLFRPEKSSPLWKNLEYKKIRFRAENGDIQSVKIYQDLPYLVSFVAQGCT